MHSSFEPPQIFANQVAESITPADMQRLYTIQRSLMSRTTNRIQAIKAVQDTVDKYPWRTEFMTFVGAKSQEIEVEITAHYGRRLLTTKDTRVFNPRYSQLYELITSAMATRATNSHQAASHQAASHQAASHQAASHRAASHQAASLHYGPRSHVSLETNEDFFARIARQNASRF
jgi:hypothetical protein